jgi:DHA1 family multidrug resistance protein-like MFS transporter
MTIPGRERWQTTLWIMFTAQLLSAVGFSVIFPFLPLYVADLGTNTALSLAFWVGMVFSSQAITMAIASPIWGSLADRIGHKPMVERAMYGGAVLLLLMGFVRSAEELVLLRTIQGAVTGTISAANALVAAEAPRERMGYAMGTLQMGLWSGTAAGPLLGGVLADAFGYRVPFYITGVLLLLSGILVTLGVPGRKPSPPQRGEPRQGMLASWRAILVAPGVGMAYGLRFLSGISLTMLLPFTPLFIQSLMQGDERIGTFTGLVVGLASGAGMATAVGFGRLGDRVGHRQVLIGCALATALAYLPQGFVREPWQLLALQALSGAAWGGITPALSALLARYTASGNEGAVYGLDNSLVAAARALAPLIGAGVVLAIGLPGIFLASAAIYGLVALLAAFYLPASIHQQTAEPQRR